MDWGLSWPLIAFSGTVDDFFMRLEVGMSWWLDSSEQLNLQEVSTVSMFSFLCDLLGE